MRQMKATNQRNHRLRQRSAGFTIVELLTVVAIIIVILSIVVVAVNSAMRSAQRANTQSLMTAINQGLVQFREDTGYLPPVLDNERNLRWTFNTEVRYSGPNPAQANLENYRDQIQEWFSFTSLADYLLGVGPTQQSTGGMTPGDGDFWSPDGYPGPGIRNPGPDGYWGASEAHPNLTNRGTYQSRLDFLDPTGDYASQSKRFREGPVLGPYIQLRDERLVGAIDPTNLWQNEELGQVRVFLPGEALRPGLNWDDMPKVIVDYWGQPIRYFRLPYPEGQPGRAYRRVDGHEVFGNAAWSPPSLSHVIAPRPFSIPAGDETNAPRMMGERFADDNGDPTTSAALQAADFALVSAGPNRSINVRQRVDDDELNRGNVVEVGQ